MASPAQPFSVLRFGSFELDPENGELRKAGVSLKIHPQPFRLLLLLAERPGQIVPREEIRNCLRNVALLAGLPPKLSKTPGVNIDEKSKLLLHMSMFRDRCADVICVSCALRSQ